jgi:hypothetical protein
MPDKSVRQLTEELKRIKHQFSHQVVVDLLHESGYSLQANRKTKEGSHHPGRNAQFEYLNGKVKWSLGRRQPVVSVDTKKKELVGDYKNGSGRADNSVSRARDPIVIAAHPEPLYNEGL